MEEEQRRGEIEEWDFFPRLERLEKITQKYLGSGQKIARDNMIISRMALVLAFIGAYRSVPGAARGAKDAIVVMMKGQGLTQEALDSTEENLRTLCNILEGSG